MLATRLNRPTFPQRLLNSPRTLRFSQSVQNGLLLTENPLQSRLELRIGPTHLNLLRERLEFLGRRDRAQSGLDSSNKPSIPSHIPAGLIDLCEKPLVQPQRNLLHHVSDDSR